MNSKFKNIIKDFSYTLGSNFITILISMIVVLVIPKVIGVKQYGYWQLYTFYSSYIGFLNIGWVEGMYLRYGGYEYKDLDKGKFSTQFILFIAYNTIASLIIFAYSIISNPIIDEKVIIRMIAVTTLLILPRGFIYYLLQATNRILEYSKLVIIDRVIYCTIIILLLIIRQNSYSILILADLVGKFITLMLAIYICRDIVFYKIKITRSVFYEITTNISVGFKLMVANISSMLIVGISRFGIEKRWGIETFAKVSLTMSMSNLLMTFINAIGVVIFPLLKRLQQKELPNLYKTLSTLIIVPVLFMLLLYFPLKAVLIVWLPQYSESLKYMALLFPICIYESKMAMIINTYLKALRKETQILIINITAVIASIVVFYISIVIVGNLELVVLSIVFLIALRGIIAEKYLANILNINITGDIIIEIFMTIAFIFTGWFIEGCVGFLMYFIAYLIFIACKFKDIKMALSYISISSKK